MKVMTIFSLLILSIFSERSQKYDFGGVNFHKRSKILKIAKFLLVKVSTLNLRYFISAKFQSYSYLNINSAVTVTEKSEHRAYVLFL